MNMKASYARLSENALASCRNPQFRALAYVLAFFHAVVQERRKYGKLGWNVAYDFNETDFRISFSLIKSYCDKVCAVVNDGDQNNNLCATMNGQGAQTRTLPWVALKYLIGEAMYGGRVSDHYDRRVLGAYLDEYFGDFLFDGFHKFTFYADANDNMRYELPVMDASYDEHLAIIERFPNVQTPDVMGLHANADVAHSTRAAKALWSNVLTLQSRSSAPASSSTSSGTDDASEGHDDSSAQDNAGSVLLNIINDILGVVTNEAYVFDLVQILRRREPNLTPSPTTVVLYQEIERHNALKDVMRLSLQELVKALSGEIGMSQELDAIADALSRGHLPEVWKSAAPPTDKDVQSWMAWYKRREAQFKAWLVDGEPNVMWLSGLQCPETYIAALIQSACRTMGWPLDASDVYTEVTNYVSADEISAKPKLGCYITGLYLEGAIWDRENSCLAQPRDKTLVSELPILRLVPYKRAPTTAPTTASMTTSRVTSSDADRDNDNDNNNDDDDASEQNISCVSQDSTDNGFDAPVYFTQSRRDAMGRGLVFSARIRSQHHHSVWTLAGVALCLNIDV